MTTTATAHEVPRDLHGSCPSCGQKTLTAARWFVLRNEIEHPPAPDPALTEEGYPTAEQLHAIRFWGSTAKDWDQAEHLALMQYVRALWHMEMWDEDDVPDTLHDGKFVRRIEMSTGGWSGNEDVIDALSENWLFWSRCWVSNQRGGHYVFEVLL